MTTWLNLLLCVWCAALLLFAVLAGDELLNEWRRHRDRRDETLDLTD